jgi:single-stranded-DNA-specific exonuclease
VQALLARGTKSGQLELKPGKEKWFLDVVGIATIADRVPLVGENRTLAHFGLKVLQKTRRPGLQHLFRTTRLVQKYLTEDDVGFMIAPRINAASRMDTPEDAFHMLATKNEAVAGVHVRHLEALNNERKGVVAAMVKDIKKRIAQTTTLASVIVMGNPEWRPALVGLVANTVAETHNRPVFLWGRDGRDVIKGSCRSDGTMSVVSLMHEVSDVFIEYGGHHASGGFSVLQKAIPHAVDVARVKRLGLPVGPFL